MDCATLATAIELSDAFQSLGVALGLGLLVGLQRERAESHVAGVRTFPLITIFGTLCAALAEQFGGWILAGGLVGVVTAMALGNLSEARHGKVGSGITTEITIISMFAVGALVWAKDIPVAVPVVVGGIVAVLLHAKKMLHNFAQKLGEKDLHAIMQFVLISFIILPVLPNETYGPEPIHVLNPREIWLMVVLVVGMSLGGYALYKKIGDRAGTVLGGVLGGMIASTAMTVSFARRSARSTNSVMAGGLAIVIASTVVYARVLTEIAVVAPNSLRMMALPFVAIMAVSGLVALAAWTLTRKAGVWLPEQENPTEMKSALMFGFMFTIVLVASAAANHYLGDRGLYAVAALSGMTGVDAITLGTARHVEEGIVSIAVGWRAIMLATMANLAFKLWIVGMLGSRRLLMAVTLMFSVTLVGSGLMIWGWPEDLGGTADSAPGVTPAETRPANDAVIEAPTPN